MLDLKTAHCSDSDMREDLIALEAAVTLLAEMLEIALTNFDKVLALRQPLSADEIEGQVHEAMRHVLEATQALSAAFGVESLKSPEVPAKNE